MNEQTLEKQKQYFSDMAVKKTDVSKLFADLSIPSFIRDWFLKQFADKNGDVSISFTQDKIKSVLPDKDRWNEILSKVRDGEKVRFLARIAVDIGIKNGIISFELPDYGVTSAQTVIPENVWKRCKGKMLHTSGNIWGIIELGIVEIPRGKKTETRLALLDFAPFRPYTLNLSYYQKSMSKFSLEERIDLLLGAIDYDSDGFKTEEEKLAMLTRLLPFVEKRLNLIELAPKGTGKSYIFSQISKKGWLSTGGTMTRAKLFYDMRYEQQGLVSNYDYVALDEIATIIFQNEAELQGAMKGYLEFGSYTVGVSTGKGDAGIILLGNIPQSKMKIECNMLETLPSVFQDSALIDRFHGFLEGWKVPRMSENMKGRGYALSSEYFAEIMHALRDDMHYAELAEAMIIIPKSADTRDTTAVKRLATAYMKLLFPCWLTAKDVDRFLFDKYCLQPAVNMRKIIKMQMGMMDKEFENKPFPEFECRQ